MARALSIRRPEAVLAILLALCLALLSLQVRRSAGQTVGESWLLGAASPFLKGVVAAREGSAWLSQSFSGRRALLAENRALRARAEAVEAELLELRDAERDRIRMVELFGSHPKPPLGTLPAHLVALEASGPFRAALIDRGDKDGVAMSGVVVATEGLLGRVVSTAPHISRIQLLGDQTAAVGVIFSRGGRLAVAHGDGKGGVAVQFVQTIVDVAPDDPLVTSGTDGVYPRDLPVGKIAAVRRGGRSQFLELPVSVAADPGRAALVFVLPPVLLPGTLPTGTGAPSAKP